MGCRARGKRICVHRTSKFVKMKGKMKVSGLRFGKKGVPGRWRGERKDSLWTGCGNGQNTINTWRYRLNNLCGVRHITKDI